VKTLYLSDLDGTLLRPDVMVSPYTAEVINRFVRSDGNFSYATARSIITASKATAGLDTGFPVITHNGTFIINNATKEFLSSNFFSADEAAYIRNAVANAVPELKAVATDVIGSNTEDGVARWIEENVL